MGDEVFLKLEMLDSMDEEGEQGQVLCQELVENIQCLLHQDQDRSTRLKPYVLEVQENVRITEQPDHLANQFEQRRETERREAQPQNDQSRRIAELEALLVKMKKDNEELATELKNLKQGWDVTFNVLPYPVSLGNEKNRSSVKLDLSPPPSLKALMPPPPPKKSKVMISSPSSRPRQVLVLREVETSRSLHHDWDIEQTFREKMLYGLCLCGERFRSLDLLRRHIVDRRRGMHLCKQRGCAKAFATLTELQNHMKAHQGPKKKLMEVKLLSCSKCGRKFNYELDKMMHDKLLGH